jgi:hypothetical protein
VRDVCGSVCLCHLPSTIVGCLRASGFGFGVSRDRGYVYFVSKLHLRGRGPGAKTPKPETLNRNSCLSQPTYCAAYQTCAALGQPLRCCISILHRCVSMLHHEISVRGATGIRIPTEHTPERNRRSHHAPSSCRCPTPSTSSRSPGLA